jgi:hypothetical protein
VSTLNTIGESALKETEVIKMTKLMDILNDGLDALSSSKIM